MTVRSKTEFEELLEPVHEGAVRFCLRLCTTRPDAEDLYHDAVLAAWHGLPRLNDARRFKPWFYRIITNTFRNQLRRRRWRQWWTRSEGASPGDGPPVDGAVHDPRGTYAARRWIGRAMSVLSADERALIVLFELEGHTIPEIARIWQKREGTIKSRLSRARTRMRAAIIHHIRSGAAATDANREVAYALHPSRTTPE